MANICCSIELEPRTLNEGQLNIAREVAADVVQKMESKEDQRITFMKGLEPVGEEKKKEQVLREEDENCDNKHVDEVIERPCQCSLTKNINAESPDQIKLKEPLSAPF